MFDNLRESADSSFYEEEPNEPYKEPAPTPSSRQFSAPPRRRSNSRFLGMTPEQRFILTLMLMLTVCIMGTLAMFVTGRMSLF